jgi:hypothetical protein
MPLDPSIISSYNPGAGIDVNALMQQRMQGMENINALERQRKADDLAMQDRAAAQQKAQADAAVKALLPAYAYGFQNPSDPDGMLALVPADQQEALAPYIDQIRNKSPEQVIAALTGSLVTSEPGRAFLENQARQRTYQVQLQQAETAAAREAREAAAVGVPKPMSAYEAERVKLDREKAEREAAAAGQPKPMSAYEAERIKLDREKAEREASGALTEKQTQGKVSLDDTLLKIKAAYDVLKAEKAIVSQDNAAAENVAARASTLTGVTVGRTIGTKAQSSRDTIANLRQSVLMDIKAATGMTAKDMDSNQDVQRLLASLGDPDQSYETVLDTIANISAKYGTGKLSAPGGTGDTGGTGGINEGTTATNPQTGERIIYRDGQWQPL